MNKKIKNAISGVVMSGLVACGMFTGLVCKAVPVGGVSEETVTFTEDNVHSELCKPLARILNYNLNTLVECYKKIFSEFQTFLLCSLMVNKELPNEDETLNFVLDLFPEELRNKNVLRCWCSYIVRETVLGTELALTRPENINIVMQFDVELLNRLQLNIYETDPNYGNGLVQILLNSGRMSNDTLAMNYVLARIANTDAQSIVDALETMRNYNGFGEENIELVNRLVDMYLDYYRMIAENDPGQVRNLELQQPDID